MNFSLFTQPGDDPTGGIDMTKNGKFAVLLALVLIFSVVASGCTGGGGEEKTSPSETYPESSEETHETSSSIGGESSVSTWQTPWDAYNPVQINDQNYYISYIKYTFTVKISGEEERSYQVIKQRGYMKAHMYSDDNGKKDLGEYNLFAYYGKITPLNDPDMNGPLEYLVLTKERTEDTDAYFLSPFPDFGAMMSGTTAVIEASYGGNYFYWSNPAAIGEYSELPYQEGDFETVMEGVSSSTLQGWIAMVGSGAWSGLEGHDLSKPDEYSFSFMGLGYNYKIDPDGTVSFGGKSLKVSNVEWSWAFGEARGQGKATIAPELPIPVETEGTFSQMGEGSYYSKLKLEDLKVSEEFEEINVQIEQSTSSGESETSTETQTETPTSTETPSESLSDNWELAWDASEPITINGRDYVVKEVTFDADYHVSGGSHVRMLIRKGYYKTELNGEDVYALYAILNIGGETYNYTVYTEYLDEYTSGILWTPSVWDMVEGPDNIKVEITGPNCHYSADDNGIEGDLSCGIISDDFQQYNMIWSYPTGFYGGIYGDVLTWVDLTSNGDGYTVEKDGSVTLAGMEFETYKIIWSGVVQGGLAQANGGTIVAPELPFPLEVTASLTMPGGGGMYIHAKLVDIKLEETS